MSGCKGMFGIKFLNDPGHVNYETDACFKSTVGRCGAIILLQIHINVRVCHYVAWLDHHQHPGLPVQLVPAPV